MLRILIIGAGGIANRHLQHLLRSKEAELVGVCDVRRESAEELAKDVEGVEVYDDVLEALDSSRPDGVFLLTPRNVRLSIIHECAKRKIPVFFEKPPCHNISTGREIQKVLSESDLIHAVGFNHRYNGVLQQITDKLDRDTLSQVHFEIVCPLAASAYMPGKLALYDVAQSGGIVGEVAIHYLDLARYVSGSEVKTLNAVGANRLLEQKDAMATHDVVGVQMLMENGVVCSVSITWGGPYWHGVGTFTSTKDLVNIRLMPPENLEGWGTLNGEDAKFEATEDETFLEHAAFFKSIRDQNMEPIRSPIADAFETFKLTAMINEMLYGSTSEME
jgi:myo-inositol 2-dehydrogenase / D-chiro-inositol 1-dehydrogenase